MPLDHLFGADKYEVVLYAARLEWLLEEAIRVAQRGRADMAYGDELDAEYHRARAEMVIREARARPKASA